MAARPTSVIFTVRAKLLPYIRIINITGWGQLNRVRDDEICPFDGKIITGGGQGSDVVADANFVRLHLSAFRVRRRNPFRTASSSAPRCRNTAIRRCRFSRIIPRPECAARRGARNTGRRTTRVHPPPTAYRSIRDTRGRSFLNFPFFFFCRLPPFPDVFRLSVIRPIRTRYRVISYMFAQFNGINVLRFQKYDRIRKVIFQKCYEIVCRRRLSNGSASFNPVNNIRRHAIRVSGTCYTKKNDV